MQGTNTNRYMTVEEVSKLLNVNIKTIYNWTYSENPLKTFKFKGVVRIRLSDLAEFLKIDISEIIPEDNEETA